MTNFINSLLIKHPLELFFITFAITIAYFVYIFRWAKKESAVAESISDSTIVDIPADHIWFLLQKEYKPRAFLLKMLEWIHTGHAAMQLDKQGNFEFRKQLTSESPLFQRLFQKKDVVDFGPYIVNRALKKAIKAHKKQLKELYKESFSFQWLPFIVGLLLSIPPLIPLIYHEILLWFPVFLVLSYLNYRAYFALNFYSPIGKKQRAQIEVMRKKLQDFGKTKEHLDVILPLALAFEQETALSKHFRRFLQSAKVTRPGYTSLWFIKGNFEPNLGQQLLRSLNKKQYK